MLQFDSSITDNRDLSRCGHFVSEELCLCTASLVLSTRLAVHKQTFLNLLRQNGRRVTKVYYGCICLLSHFQFQLCTLPRFHSFWSKLLNKTLRSYYLNTSGKGKVKGKGAHKPKVQTAGACPGFLSMPPRRITTSHWTECFIPSLP